MIKPPQQLRDFEALVQVVKALRDPVDGCPWDIEQDHQSLAPYMIEEAFELVEAIERLPLKTDESRRHMIEELGDVLLQVVLHSEVARQAGEFEILDVIESLNQKMIYRHSHVFGDVQANSATEALANWDRMKELAKTSAPADSFGIPAGLPALQRAQKIGAKTKKLKFDWTHIRDVRNKVLEELAEFDEVLADPQAEDHQKKLTHEMGDLLFSVAQLARHAGLDAEGCLREGNRRFEDRFFGMKKLALSRGQVFENLSPDELEGLWQEIKRL